jgi:hypothetical protein
MAQRACAILDRSVRIFPIAAPAAALHRGTLNLALGRRKTDAVLEDWRQAIGIARELTLPHQELRLQAAIAARIDEGDPEHAAILRRMTELIEMLELRAPSTSTSPWPLPRSLPGGVQVEGKDQIPLS